MWGWCRKREDFRLFKLNRMDGLELSEREFAGRQVPMPDLTNERIFPGRLKVKAVFEPECKWRLVEEFGPKCFQVQPDGKLLFQADYTDKEHLITWLLSFRDRAELLEPEEIREEMRQSILRMEKKYQDRG